MAYSFWQIIALTPWWTYVFIWYLLYLSFKATKPRIVSLYTFILLHVICMALILIGLVSLIQINSTNLMLCLGSAFGGIFLGWLHFRLIKIKAIKHEAKFYLPGSWLLLIVIILLVSAKYYLFGYQVFFDPQVLKQEKYLSYILIISGLILGLFIGRMLYVLRCIKHGPYVKV